MILHFSILTLLEVETQGYIKQWLITLQNYPTHYETRLQDKCITMIPLYKESMNNHLWNYDVDLHTTGTYSNLVQ